MEWAKLVGLAGPLALAAFAGTLLGGVALSFFWKNFGPWKLLEAAKRECETCKSAREKDADEHAELRAKISDLTARYEILKTAVNKAGLGLRLGPLADDREY